MPMIPCRPDMLRRQRREYIFSPVPTPCQAPSLFPFYRGESKVDTGGSEKRGILPRLWSAAAGGEDGEASF